ncbi:MAG: putative ABC transporter permease [Ruminiclostridium sp.]|nr:putative ABC transporter permease [Ruminiclostridium sp.]
MIPLFTEFFFYSFLGFLLEVLYARLLGREGHGRKCLLFLPLCPVYGLGAVAILHMPPLLQSRSVAVFIAGGLLATLAEYAVGAFYLWGCGVRFWDYSQVPGNLLGLICPLYTLYWGLLAVTLVQGIHPLFAPWLTQIPPEITVLLFPLFGADVLVSLWLLHRTGSPDCLMWYKAFLSPRRASM